MVVALRDVVNVLGHKHQPIRPADAWAALSPALLPMLGVEWLQKASPMTTPGEHRIERGLAAILAADVAGYRRLTSSDKAGTARTARPAGVQEGSRQ
jgi:class 3 adenylate cyclase